MSSGVTDDDMQRLVKILEQQLATLQNSDVADDTLEEILKRADGSEADRSDHLTGDRGAFLRRVEQLGRGPSRA